MRSVVASPQTLEEALHILAAGGVIAHATETCYGLACDLTNPQAVAKLFAIKNRPANQPVSALFASVDAAKKYVEWNAKAEEFAQQHLPGPLTLILPLHKDAQQIFPTPHPLRPTPSLGIRISSHPLAMELAKRFGKPLSTTSANLHGQPNPYSAQEIERQFTSAVVQPNLILDSGKLPSVPPSTVINLTQAASLRIERNGNLSGI
ncbi:threonylcarbamoyl-AMP synthase [Candidatus Peregrinibacteria bacterium CG1_02_54_53]|nr:MAG: threonylcarbamoyl-AMP synthase [Candidatus Peregrinibacteria bacterium CG1_02_54_53]